MRTQDNCITNAKTNYTNNIYDTNTKIFNNILNIVTNKTTITIQTEYIVL